MKEHRVLEFKREITNTFLKTVSAYANFGTGQIIFGIDDQGQVVGIDRPDEACMKIENKINEMIKPKPDFSLTIDQGTGVISLTVLEGSFKPYLYNGKAYRRSDTSTVEADQIELKRLILLGSNRYFEEIPIEEQNLSFHYLFEVLKTKINLKNPGRDTLRTLGLITVDNKYNNAALLLSDDNSFPGIDVIRFGSSRSEIIYREKIDDCSILEQLEKAEAIFNQYYRVEEISGMERKESFLVPLESFRETIANALVHRVWDINSSIRISMKADSIEISSPGGLPIGISEEEYLNGYISVLRNPTIANIFFRLGFIEMFGTGIRRIKEAYKGIRHKPVFQVSDNSVVTVLPTTTKRQDISTDEKRILDELSTGMHLASSEIARKTGFSKDKVVRLVNMLIAKTYVNKEGSGRGTKYYRN